MRSFFKLLLLFIGMFVSQLWGDSFSVSISRESDLVDAPFNLSMEALSPGEEVLVKTECKDSDGISWKSNSKFRADSLGELDLSKVAPIEGQYHLPDAAGIIWSMLPEGGQAQCYYNSNEWVDISLKVFRDSQLVFEKEIRRYIKAPNVKMLKVHDGIVGEFYTSGSDVKKTGVIVLGGSNGGVSRAKAQLLASHGYPTLALAYFRAEGLSNTLENIPLEYVADAAGWLKEQATCDKVTLLGTSRGAELALLVASYFPNDVDDVIAIVPSSVAHNAIPNKRASAWSYAGVSIPFMEGLEDETVQGLIGSNEIPFHEGSYIDPYELSDTFLTQEKIYNSQFKRAQIPVENMKASLLLLSADDDKMWPSQLYCQQIIDRIKENSSEIKVTHNSFKDAGHGITFPCIPSENLPYYHPVAQKWFTLGGTMEGNAQANQNAWSCILDFLQEQ